MFDRNRKWFLAECQRRGWKVTQRGLALHVVGVGADFMIAADYVGMRSLV